MTDIRLPNIAANADASTQMAQMRSYLYQMVEQLNWALSAVDSGNGVRQQVETVHTSHTTSDSASKETKAEIDQRMATLKDLIIKTAEEAGTEIGRLDDAIKEIEVNSKCIDDVKESYYRSTSATELVGGEWSDTYPGWAQGTYIWTRSTITFSDGSDPVTTTPVCVTGAQGSRGEPGSDGTSPTVSISKTGRTTTITVTDKNGVHTQTVEDGADGTPGTPGTPGTDGKTPYFHVKYSDDGGETFTADNGETPGQYIGTYTDYTKEDSGSVSAYTWAKIKGAPGDDGVGVAGVDVLYRLSASNTALAESEMPPDGWDTTAPEIDEKAYLWSCSKVSYTDGTTTYTKPYCVTADISSILDRKITGVYSDMDRMETELKGIYVARSDFGTYLEEISQRIEADPTQLSRYFRFASDIRADMDRVETDFTSYRTDVEGYIRQGIVDYEGTVPIIGIAIGQDIRTTQSGVETEQGVYDVIDKSSNMSIWTTEKLSFYIGGQEAAYFSNGKLTVAQIATDRITGAGKWDVSFTGGVKFKWMGG